MRPKRGFEDINVGVGGRMWFKWFGVVCIGGVEPPWCDTWRASCCALHVCTKSYGVMHDSWLVKVTVLNCQGASLDGLSCCQLLRDFRDTGCGLSVRILKRTKSVVRVFISVHFVATLLRDCTASHFAFVLGKSGKSSGAAVCTGAWTLQGNKGD